MQNFDKCSIENVAGRDINVVLPQPVTTVNLIKCPMCESLVSPCAEICAACMHPVRQHFENIHREHLGRVSLRFAIAFGILAMFGLLGIQYLEMPPPWGMYLILGTFAMFGLAFLFMTIGENITKGIR